RREWPAALARSSGAWQYRPRRRGQGSIRGISHSPFSRDASCAPYDATKLLTEVNVHTGTRLPGSAATLRGPRFHRNEGRTNHLTRAGWLLLCWRALGCQKENTASSSLPTPEVTVAPPVEKEVQEYERFTGRTVAEKQVEVRARVSGYLVKAPF